MCHVVNDTNSPPQRVDTEEAIEFSCDEKPSEIDRICIYKEKHIVKSLVCGAWCIKYP